MEGFCHAEPLTARDGAVRANLEVQLCITN